MRILLFSVIVCLAGLSVIIHSEAIPWRPEEDKALGADSIAVGRIISYQDDGAHRYYEISIIKWIKNPQPEQTIMMRSVTPDAFNPHFPFAIFQKKDLGLFYLRLIDGKWQSTNYSRQIWASEINDTIHNMKKLVGNNNPDSSVSLERTCKEGHINAVKNRTGELFCVKPQTLQKLRERGWTEPLGNIVFEKPSESNDDKTIPRPRYQMKMGIPLEEIKCKEGFYSTFKIDRVTPACVTEKTLDELMLRGWAPLRIGMPAETNILITYGAIQVYPHNVTKKLDPRSPYFNDVFWVNNDIVPHTVIAEDGTWSTEVIESGKIGSVCFNKTGIYKYFIKEKPSTTGFVEFSGIVEPDE